MCACVCVWYVSLVSEKSNEQRTTKQTEQPFWMLDDFLES